MCVLCSWLVPGLYTRKAPIKVTENWLRGWTLGMSVLFTSSFCSETPKATPAKNSNPCSILHHPHLTNFTVKIIPPCPSTQQHGELPYSNRVGLYKISALNATKQSMGSQTGDSAVVLGCKLTTPSLYSCDRAKVLAFFGHLFHLFSCNSTTRFYPFNEAHKAYDQQVSHFI